MRRGKSFNKIIIRKKLLLISMSFNHHLSLSFGFVLAILLISTFFLGVEVSATPYENYSVTLVKQPAMGNGEKDAPVINQLTGLSQAPTNPEFIDYQRRIKNSVEQETAATELSNISTSYVFFDGVIPSPVDLTHTKGQQIKAITPYPMVGAIYPGSFDIRSSGKVSSVKNQGSAGSCWAFAAVASLESYLLPAEPYDFSENNLKNTLAITYTDGFNRTWNKGGNDWMSTAYLTRWSGPIVESDDPYNASSSYSPSGLSPARHVQNVYFLPQRVNSTDNSNIKYALTTWGAVTAGINFLDPYYRSATYAFYNGGTNATISHEITLVGWNDSYSRTNFATQPPGDGAFIAKNSWGSAWGNQGYFYISYYDLTIGKVCSVFTSEPVSNFDRVYLYDPLGWTYNLGYGSTTAQFANIFTAQSGETLKAVGFYTPTSNTSYIISIYLSPNSGPINSGGYAARASGTLSSPGYHTVDIPDVILTSGQKYSIVVSATTPGYNFPIPIEDLLNNYSNHATAHSGESYVSSTGVIWTDLTNMSGYSNANVCLKGYTKTISITPGSDKITIFRPSSGYWYFDYNLDGIVDNSFRYGGSGDQIIKGDWQGTGTDGIAIFRPSTGYWYFDYNLNGIVDNSIRYGGSSDQIIVGKWV
jgi:C1A family cysteine protease